MQRRLSSVMAAAALAAAAAATTPPAAAHGNGLSEASALSLMPLAVSVAAPSMVLTAGVSFVVVSVSVVAEGTIWVLERVSDGVRISVTAAASAVGAVSLAAGAVVTTLACGTGYVLSAAGRVIAFIPNEVGRSLLYNERVTR